MWSGDVQSGYPTQWALNPSAYQNVPNEEVDWATLAQQWIKMKETFPADQVPPAPPPPSIKADVQAEEVPMDVAKDDVSPSLTASTSQDGSNWNNWNNWQQWNWGWNSTSDKTTPYNYSSNTQAYNSESAPTTTFEYNHGANIPKNHHQQGYWSGNQAPYMKHKPAEWRGDSRSSSSRRHTSSKVEEVDTDTTSIIDAAKRKQLPAWIREGLEKMEREKQKKLERERMLKEREEEMVKKKEEEEAALASGIPIKSKFETDSEGSEKGDEEIVEKPKKSRFRSISPDQTNSFVPKAPSPTPPVKIKSREEIMQDVMQQVRYVLTDILMTVTNEEMEKIAEEVLADFRAKAPATQLRKTQAFTSLTGKLGLGIYDSDSEENSEDSESEQTSKKRNGVDSDEELRERIIRKKEEFSRIERDIEYEVEQQEERERQREQTASAEEPQVEPCQTNLGVRSDVKTEKNEDIKVIVDSSNNDNINVVVSTPQRNFKVEKESSEEATEDSDHNSSSTSRSSSRSSSGSRYKKSRKSSKRKKEKKSSKRKRKRSSSRGSERKKSSRRRKSSHSRRYERSHSRSHSRDDYHYRRSRSPSHHRRHSSESSHRRRHHSYTPSPDHSHSRGKKSSHRSRD